jgi:hypothetical protein
MSLFTKNKRKAASISFDVEFNRSGKKWSLDTKSFVRVWQTSNDIETFVTTINEAAASHHGEEYYPAEPVQAATLKSRLTYLRNHKKLPLKKLEGEQALWNSNMNNQRIDWDELRNFCLSTENE